MPAILAAQLTMIGLLILILGICDWKICLAVIIGIALITGTMLGLFIIYRQLGFS